MKRASSESSRDVEAGLEVSLCSHPQHYLDEYPKVFSKQHQNSHSPPDLLLNADLPVELLGDGSPEDLPLVQAVVHTPKDDCASVLAALLTVGGKGRD